MENGGRDKNFLVAFSYAVPRAVVDAGPAGRAGPGFRRPEETDARLGGRFGTLAAILAR